MRAIWAVLLIMVPLVSSAACFTVFNTESVDAMNAFLPPVECRFSSQPFKSQLPTAIISTQEVLLIAHSQSDEIFTDFVQRVGRLLVTYSATTGFEACGVFAGNLKQYGIIVTSNRSALACVTNHDVVPNQMITLKRTIHSHGASNTTYSHHDAQLLPRPYKPNTRLTTDPYMFSEQDLKFSGYLATPTGVLYYDKHTQKTSLVPVRLNLSEDL